MTTPSMPDIDPALGPRYPLGVEVSERTPEAPSPSPTLELFMLVTENEVANRGDGGRLLFQEIQRGQNAGYIQDEHGQRRSVITAANLVISAAADAFMLQWPWKGKSGKEGRPFRVTVEQIAWADVPPDPEKAAPRVLSARELLAQAHAAARRDGDTALAAALEEQLTTETPVATPGTDVDH